ncbi:MAG: DUF4062 domain-containing protein [Clostridia bacterium]|nr:DUF4062 domain-containing protein [Clostridia bacterium]
MKKKYQVFVSSTYEDLKDERAAVMQCLLDNDCIPVGMEQFPASNMSQMDYIKKMLDDCDYYLLISAGRYGSLDFDGIGFTEKEYDYAISKAIPVMSVLHGDIDSLPSKKCETTDVGREKLNVFRQKISTGKMIDYYSDISALKYCVSNAINRCIRDFPAVGWVRGNELTNTENFLSTFKSIVNQFSFEDEERTKYTQQIKELEMKLNSKNKISITRIPNEAGGTTVIIGDKDSEFREKTFVDSEWIENELQKI